MKHVKIEYVLSAAALVLICFTVGFFLGRNANRAENVMWITTDPKETEAAEMQSVVEATTEVTGSLDDAGGATPLNINTATAADLTALPRIGEVLAQRIVDYRAENGSFTSVEDLLEVNGIGDQKFEKIESLITVR